MSVLRTDRPTNDLTFAKIQMAISPQGVVKPSGPTSCLVLRRLGFKTQNFKTKTETKTLMLKSQNQ